MIPECANRQAEITLDVVFHILRTATPHEVDDKNLVIIDRTSFNQLCESFNDYSKAIMKESERKRKEAEDQSWSCGGVPTDQPGFPSYVDL